MTDIAQNLVVRDVDMRVLGVLTLSILLHEIGGAYEMIMIMTLGILWAFLTTPDSKEIINSSIMMFERKISPLIESKIWVACGRPIAYMTFVLFVLFLAIG